MTILIALGGGVVGDMTGFAAACYQRGIPFIQIPTTLLAQVDSSVGGKTAINHPLGKNMIGAFYQPHLVLADTDVLKTLPDRELRAGLAEVIKYALIRDMAFLNWLETHLDALLNKDSAALEYAIYRSCQHKAEIVANDEQEHGERALLNLGHTFGHAIETGLGYGAWLYGEAVSFRTRGPLLRWINGLFAHIWSSGLGSSTGLRGLAYEPLTPAAAPSERSEGTLAPFSVLLAVRPAFHPERLGSGKGLGPQCPGGFG